MFPPLPYNDQMRSDYCKKTWNVNIRNDWTALQFWGRNISSASNIVFSNGVSALTKHTKKKMINYIKIIIIKLLDPWHNGGPLIDISETVVAVIIAEGAHHLDLR